MIPKNCFLCRSIPKPGQRLWEVAMLQYDLNKKKWSDGTRIAWNARVVSLCINIAASHLLLKMKESHFSLGNIPVPVVIGHRGRFHCAGMLSDEI